MASVQRKPDLQIFFEDCNNDCRPAAAVIASASTAISASSVVMTHIHKSKHDLHDEDSDDDATTTYSSWHEDHSSQLSSSLCLTCRSSHDEDDNSQLSCPPTIISHSPSGSLCSARAADVDEADSEDEEDGNTSLLRHLSLSSSYYSAVTSTSQDEPTEFSNGNGDECEFPAVVIAQREQSHGQRHSNKSERRESVVSSLSLAESDALSELAERAHHMLRRERSTEYKVEDYFFHQGSEAALFAAALSPGHYSPIDTSCRSKMMEWSFRVLEYSFPRSNSSSPQHQHNQVQRRDQQPRRKYSIQAIQIVSQAFNLIDRIATRYFYQNVKRPMDRSQYKLICMSCLHLAAKTCGFFGLYDRDIDEYSSLQYQDGQNKSYQCKDASDPSQRVPRQAHEDDSCCYSLSQDSTSTLSLSSMASHDLSASSDTSSFECNEGQTILSTPARTHSSNEGSAHQREILNDYPRKISVDNTTSCQPRPTRQVTYQDTKVARPPLNILSLTGLATLCQNDYSIEQLIGMELDILQTLDWKLMSVTSIDWCHLLLELLVVCANVVHHGRKYNRRGRMSSHNDVDIEEIRERTLTNIECAMETNLLFAPSLVALAAVVHALDEYHNANQSDKMQCILSLHEKIVSGLLPYGDEEVNEVRLCF